VVFIASWVLPSESWSYQMMALADRGFRCVAYDRRGHGRSSDPGRGYDYDTLADDLAAVLDTLDLRDVTLVGFSMGAAEMIRYITRHGSGRIAGLVSIAPPTPYLQRTPDNPDGFDDAVIDALHQALESDFPLWVDENVLPFVPTATPPMVEWLRGLALQTSHKAMVGFLSTTTVFGTAIDITLSELAIEAFFPADAATADALRDGKSAVSRL
jgi:non-heme chloroperoxidase